MRKRWPAVLLAILTTALGSAHPALVQVLIPIGPGAVVPLFHPYCKRYKDAI